MGGKKIPGGKKTVIHMKHQACIDLLRTSALHKNHNRPLPNFRVIALCSFSLYNSMSGRYIELYKEKF